MKAILEAARQKVGVDGWHGYLVENVIGGYIVTGSIAVPKKTGKNKGRLKWTKELYQKVIIADGELIEH